MSEVLKALAKVACEVETRMAVSDDHASVVLSIEKHGIRISASHHVTEQTKVVGWETLECSQFGVAGLLMSEVVRACLIAEKRGTGRTRRQMEDAPKNAVFVWCNDDRRYATDLARSIKREDLMIVSPRALEDPSRFYGMTFSAIILDHAAKLSDRARETVRNLETRIRRGPAPALSEFSISNC